ncbi:hypothetical protein ATE92_2779 [Ulvibacter sp. MAR_2010_11]|uniref:hypothetical protein n=1 Tax=Ulvibacter sp. MAR_2010_11 TaxID=1250229 RepID=UPI000C2C0E92|nr:hypothetical protein [Ulvibacter sp. MAR_2010_11]PKA84582.1 hypothetical protein ATE92_2779 [Ulvibacter sp. MAR_2010_11]
MVPTRVNIEKKLINVRNRRITGGDILAEVHRIFAETTAERTSIRATLIEKPSEISEANKLCLDLIASERIFHIEDIRKLCVTYRLRFLDAHFFKGTFPSEAISEIRKLEKEHHTQLQHFKIMAPSKLLKLENADDPVLFVPMGNDYFYFIYKWGNDLHPLRKLLMWPYRNFENLVFTVLILSMVLTAMTPIKLFSHTAAMQEYLLLFLFMFKAVAGIVLFYGFAKGKNFNTAIWDSQYYNA